MNLEVIIYFVAFVDYGTGLILSLLLPSLFLLHCNCASVSCSLFVWFHPSACFLLICSLDVCVSILLQLTVKTSNASMSGMPSNARPFPGTTKNVYNFSLFLWLIVTLQIPNYRIGFRKLLQFCCHQLLFLP